MTTLRIGRIDFKCIFRETRQWQESLQRHVSQLVHYEYSTVAIWLTTLRVALLVVIAVLEAYKRKHGVMIPKGIIDILTAMTS
jgi:hypothetical protein